MLGGIALTFAALAATPAAAQQRPCDPPTPLGPSGDLYCIELIAAPGIKGARGTVELAHLPGPFTVAVTAEGLPRHRLALSADGLPSPGSLGPYRTYVAWVAPISMHPVRRLGEIGNGRADLGVVDLEKFIVLVTAEPSARVPEPSARVVLRGQSPSTRLFPPDRCRSFPAAAPGASRSAPPRRRRSGSRPTSRAKEVRRRRARAGGAAAPPW